MELSRHKSRARIAFRSGAILAALAVLVLSLVAAPQIAGANANDKLNHFIAYAALAVLFTGAQKRPVAYILTAAALILYGLGLEGLQGVTPGGRQTSWADAGANTLGVIAGCFAAWIARRALLAYSAATASSVGTS